MLNTPEADGPHSHSHRIGYVASVALDTVTHATHSPHSPLEPFKGQHSRFISTFFGLAL
jgi:hypothetical protein